MLVSFSTQPSSGWEDTINSRRLDAEQPDSLTEAMIRLVDDADLCQRLATRALENAAQRSWAKVFDEFWTGDWLPVAESPSRTPANIRAHSPDREQAIA